MRILIALGAGVVVGVAVSLMVRTLAREASILVWLEAEQLTGKNDRAQ